MMYMSKHFLREGIKDNSHLRPYTWRKSWIRPYESLYSVFNTFKRVNAFSDKSAIRELSGNSTYSTNSGIIQNTMYHSCLKANDRRYDYLTDKILIEAFSSNTETCLFPKLDGAARSLLISPNYNHCPECDKLGYHSWMFQYSPLKKCPIHNIPLIEGNDISLNQLTDNIDKHPALNKIDTAPIDKVYKSTLSGINAIQVIRLNSFYSKKSLSETSIQPLFTIGEEIYCAKMDNTRNIRDEMSKKFINLIFSLHDQLETNFGYDIAIEENEEYYRSHIDVKKILSAVFRDRPDHIYDNPTFENTFASDLQIYISFLEILSKEKNDNKLLHQYLCEIFAYKNPMDFKRIFRPNSRMFNLYNHTPAYIVTSVLKDDDMLFKLNDNRFVLRCIDDHVKYQWNYIKTHFAEYIDGVSQQVTTVYTPGDNKQFINLPHVMYLLITDNDNFCHVIRLVEEESTSLF